MPYVVLFSACFAHAVYVLLSGVSNPLLDLFSFRQTQTAITAYWIWHDGLRLAYETPVLGYPWPIPLEFPLFQWLTASLRSLGVPIDVGGRFIAFAFYIAILYPLWLLARELGFNLVAWLIVATLFLASPLYVYWSRTVMIESSALFFSMSALAFTTKYLKDPRPLPLIFSLIAGCFATLTKATTFPAYAFLAGLVILSQAIMWLRKGPSISQARSLVLATAAIIVPFFIGFLWVWYTDHIKLQNPFGAHLTSASLTKMGWAFAGTDELISLKFWQDIFIARVLTDIFGYAYLLAPVAALAAFLQRKFALPMLAAAVGFIIPFVLFTNLHAVHSYYQYANGLLALVAVGLGISAVGEAGQRTIATILLTVVVTGQLAYFHLGDLRPIGVPGKSYADVTKIDFSRDPIFKISRATRKLVPADQRILVLGQDWSSAIPYYSERKALVLPNWFPMDLTVQALQNPERFLEGKLGAVIYCSGYYGYNEKTSLIEDFLAGRSVLKRAGTCQLLSPLVRR